MSTLNNSDAEEHVDPSLRVCTYKIYSIFLNKHSVQVLCQPYRNKAFLSCAVCDVIKTVSISPSMSTYTIFLQPISLDSSTPVLRYAYADDTAILASDSNPDQVTKALQEHAKSK